MVFRPPKKNPRFADLKGILAQSKDTESAVYQTIQEIIERLDQFRDTSEEQLGGAKADITNILKNLANKNATYITKEDESSILPNSVQLLAGIGITFDDSVPNKRTISSTGGGGLGNHYDCPLSDGNVDEAHLIFANGECIIVQIPV